MRRVTSRAWTAAVVLVLVCLAASASPVSGGDMTLDRISDRAPVLRDRIVIADVAPASAAMSERFRGVVPGRPL